MRKNNNGAERLRRAFARAKSEGRAALIPYITAGDPDLEMMKSLVPALVDGGADIVEIGLPFSDPLADGPTIQRSGQRALAAGTTRQGVFDAVRSLRDSGIETPFVLLAYYNCIYRRGEQKFVAEARVAGIDGIVTPDLPPEEAGALRTATADAGIALIPLVAPTSTGTRRRLVGKSAQAFIYCVSVTGVTGARRRLADTVAPFIEKVRKDAPEDMPLALGFGISDIEQARACAALADGVIVGSALIEKLERAPSRDEALTEARTFIAELRGAAMKSPERNGANGGGVERRVSTL